MYKNVVGHEINAIQGLQQIDYKYNIRGWLTDINNTNQLQEENQLEDQFAFKINYQEGFDASQQDVEALYNGNITQTYWRTNIDNQLRYYTYSYDTLNRLKNAYYGKNNSYKKNFDEHLEYDKNGKNTQLADAFNIGLGAKGATLGLAQYSRLATNLGRLSGAASVGITVYSKWDRMQNNTKTTMDWVDIGVSSGALIGSIAFPPAALYIGVGAFIYGTIRFYQDYN